MSGTALVTLLSLIASVITLWLFVGGGNLYEYVPYLRDKLGPKEVSTVIEASSGSAYPVSSRAPKAPEGFRYSRESAMKMMPTVCQEIEHDGSCYKRGWKPWVRRVAKSMSDTELEYEAMELDSSLQSAVSLAIDYPDNSTRVVFEGCRPHFCDSSYVWFLIDPTKRAIDIVWQDTHRGIRYIGDNSVLLRKAQIHSWLSQVRDKCHYNVRMC